LKAAIRFFTKSNFSSAHLKKAREDVGLGQGLIKIGKTRFVTHWSASVALEKNLELIKELVRNETIKPNVGHFPESQLYLDDDLKRIKRYRNSLKRMCHIAGFSRSLPFTLRLLSRLHGPYGPWNHRIQMRRMFTFSGLRSQQSFENSSPRVKLSLE
jgi:hypothetical protein